MIICKELKNITNREITITINKDNINITNRKSMTTKITIRVFHKMMETIMEMKTNNTTCNVTKKKTYTARITLQ